MATYWTPARRGIADMDNLAKEVYREYNGRRPIIVRSRKHSRWSSGVCKMCGEFFEMITFDHAAMHGFKNPTEMAKKGDINWMEYV